MTLVVVQFAIADDEAGSIGARVQSEMAVEKLVPHNFLESAVGSCGFSKSRNICNKPVVRLLAVLDEALQVAEFFELRGSRLIPRQEVNAAFAVEWIRRPAALELKINIFRNFNHGKKLNAYFNT